MKFLQIPSNYSSRSSYSTLWAVLSTINFVSFLISPASAAIIHRGRTGGQGSSSGGSGGSNNLQGQGGGGMPYYDMNTNMSEFEDMHDEQALISRLLWNYDPAARPVYNASHPVIVKFSFALIQLCDMVSVFFGL